jgi:hypothetical protein
MVSRQFRLFVPALAGFLATLAVGCGGIDERVLPRPDGAGHADAAFAQPDLRPPPPDTNPPPADATAPPDGGSQDGERSDAGAGVGAEPSGADGGAATDGDEGADTSPPPPPVTVVVLPDTQYYSAAYPYVFTGQTTWIRNQKSALNIVAVLHVGDLVDGDTPAQWTAANTAMRALDGLLPYVLVPGNHDSDANRKSLIDNYFGPASMPWITGTMTAGQIENNYALLDIGPRKWLVLGLEFGPRDAVVAWADRVLKTYPTLPAIIVTHAYLYSDGTRYNVAVAGTDPTRDSYQWWYPQYYGFTASQGINDGEMLWQKLVLPNPNVRLVFSGHQTGWARLSSTRPDGSVVHQLLSDYQWWGDGGPYFGYGWLRVMQIDYGKQTIAVRTYSPYLGQYLADDANQFTLDWNL